MGLGIKPFTRAIDAERIAVNVATLYREFGASPGPANPLGAFEAMAKIRKARGQSSS